ncbi:MAG TPA: hypothetical protein DCZ92_06715 [Elusimicrobia bacterium]|nr:MAG: hypothetical protein A2016_05250 [Elusimicrobia bacterium GWF2_62_30]HBA60497.1 hypothetical protein [Elusimicrobiota bacterium]
MKITLISLNSLHGYQNNPDADFLDHPPTTLAIYRAFLKDRHDAEISDLGIELIRDGGLLREINALGLRASGAADAWLAGRENSPELDKVFARILRKVDYKKARVVGIAVPHGSYLPMALVLAKKIKDAAGATIVFGGFTMLQGIAEDFFEKYPCVDYAAVERSFYPFLELVKALDSGKKAPVIRGLASKGHMVHPRESSDAADKLPAPDFGKLSLETYRKLPKSSQPYYRFNAGKVLPLQYFFMDGCPFNCSFCKRPAITHRAVTFKPVDRITEEVAALKKKHRTDCFFFVNSCVNLSDKFLDGLCDAMIKRRLNIAWCDSAKPKNVSKDLLLKMRRAGCISLTWGLESGCDGVLKKMNKLHTTKEASASLRNSHEAGIWNRANIIVGFPGETEEQFRETLQFLRENADYIDNLSVFKFFLCPSTIMSEPEKYGIEVKDIDLQNTGPDFKCYAYDEVGGLKWEEKLAQLDRRCHAVVSTFRELKKNVLLSNQDHSYNLFHLYKKFKTKNAVRAHLKEVSTLVAMKPHLSKRKPGGAGKR